MHTRAPRRPAQQRISGKRECGLPSSASALLGRPIRTGVRPAQQRISGAAGVLPPKTHLNGQERKNPGASPNIDHNGRVLALFGNCPFYSSLIGLVASANMQHAVMVAGDVNAWGVERKIPVFREIAASSRSSNRLQVVHSCFICIVQDHGPRQEPMSKLLKSWSAISQQCDHCKITASR